MRIYTKSGDLAFSSFTFPDGQPHWKLETYAVEFRSCTIETAIKSPADLLLVLLASDVLRQHGYSEVLLDIRYLMGARMDRAIDVCQPFTLEIIARLLNGAGFSKVRILDVHSEVATRLIRNSVNVRPYAAFDQIIATLGDITIVRPDEGAENRTSCFANSRHFIRCSKKRDPQTGKLSGFECDRYNPNPNEHGPNLLIVDDICDGGGTFVGLAKELRKAGAKKVFLFCTHGIFSKGLPLDGIDRVFTTDSYSTYRELADSIPYLCNYAVWIPISMKDIK